MFLSLHILRILRILHAPLRRTSRAVAAALLLGVLGGCFCGEDSDAADEVVETAKSDLSCDHVEGKRVAGGSASRSCSTTDYVIEGCGQLTYYRCTSGDGFGCDYTCTAMESRELRSN